MSILDELHLSQKNAWSSSKGDEIISVNPATGKDIASVYSGSAEDYDHTIKKAQSAFQTWRKVPAPKRGELVRALGDALRKNKTALGSLVSLEMGKSKQEGLGEVQEMLDMADFAVGQSRMLYGNTMHSERPEHRMYEQWHPLGIVTVFSAFNFPVAVWAWNAFIAAICGNVIIWKPSSKTPLCAVAVQQICNQVMADVGLENIFNLFITHDNKLSEKMVSDVNVPLVSFTGSSKVGKHINQIVSNRFGRTILELSGNNAIIVDESANLKLAIPAILFGAIGTAGQRCTSTRRLIVHDSIYQTVKDALVKGYQKITVGDPLDEKNLMGPLIDEDAQMQFKQAIQAATKSGGKILSGGNTIDREGFYVEPTLIEAKNDWEIVQKETFAPILYVMSYKTMDEAINIHNHSAFGLSSAIFTNDLRHAELFLSARGSDCGIANVNIGTSGAEIGGAFGGEKDTGGGREAGSDAWKAYMRRQTNTINWGETMPLAQGIKFEL